MALKRLATGEMVSLSGPLTQEDHPDRLLLAGIPATAALLPTLDSAHRQLLIAQPKAAMPERVAAIILEERTLDIRHDTVIRGVLMFLQALAYLTTNPEEAKQLIELQQVLLPEGLLATQKTYREEAGQAALLESRLTPAHIALLKKIKTPNGTLWSSIQEWIQLGAALGKLEDERGGGVDAVSPTAADGLAARNRWIRTVNAIISVLALVEADEPGVTAILSRIAEAERRAERRGESAAATPPADAPAPVEAPAPVDEAKKKPSDS
jgi:hypothetical protein